MSTYIITLLQHSHTPSLLYRLLVHLQTQDPHESAFSCFSGITALYHTKSTRLLCKLVHFTSKILMRVHFLVLVASQHSTTPSLLDYYATWCTFRPKILMRVHFLVLVASPPLHHTKSTRLLCNLVHFTSKILMRVHFLDLVASQHSHTPSLLDYYATWCTSHPRSS